MTTAAWIDIVDHAREREDIESVETHKIINENAVLRERLDRMEVTFEAFIDLLSSYGVTHQCFADDVRMPQSSRDRFQATAKLARGLSEYAAKEMRVARMDF